MPQHCLTRSGSQESASWFRILIFTSPGLMNSWRRRLTVILALLLSGSSSSPKNQISSLITKSERLPVCLGWTGRHFHFNRASRQTQSASGASAFVFVSGLCQCRCPLWLPLFVLLQDQFENRILNLIFDFFFDYGFFSVFCFCFFFESAVLFPLPNFRILIFSGPDKKLVKSEWQKLKQRSCYTSSFFPKIPIKP